MWCPLGGAECNQLDDRWIFKPKSPSHIPLVAMGNTCGGSYSAPAEIPTKWFPDFEANLPSLQGKVFCITGCTSGTGYVAARTAARKGAHVVMLNRQSGRAEAAEKALKEEVPNAKVTQVACDLQDLASVQAAASNLKSLFGSCGVDVLCNNAGVMALADQATKDGYDVQMQTNHLSHFLLTKELFPLLQKAASERGEARVVQHSSGGRKFPTTELDAKYLGKNGGDLGGNGNSMFFGGARWERLWVKANGIPFWGKCTTHLRTYFSGWIESDVHWGHDLDFHPWPGITRRSWPMPCSAPSWTAGCGRPTPKSSPAARHRGWRPPICR